MKTTSVRGTPVRSISGANEGQMAGKPSGYDGTVNTQYRGDQTGGGTPYTSRDGNSATAKRVASQGKFGDVIDTNAGVNFSEPNSNGNGVILDGMTRESDYSPRGASAMDSPVPQGSPAFQAGAMRQENIAHLGKGKGADASQAGDVILNIGGVMSRGMLGVSKAGESATELVEDDVLSNLGSGGPY